MARRRAAGTATGPSAWDGYAATVVSDAALEAQRTGAWTTVSLQERPAFYAADTGGEGLVQFGKD